MVCTTQKDRPKNTNMSQWTWIENIKKRISEILSMARKQGFTFFRKSPKWHIIDENNRTLPTAKQPKQYPYPVNKQDPYQWPHPHDRQWFLIEALKLLQLAEADDEINKIEYLYCVEATIQHILIHHNAALVKGEEYFTFNLVLDLLSAAYCIPLLPNQPSFEAKQIAEYVLFQKIPPLEHA